MAWTNGEKSKKEGLVLKAVPVKGNDAMITALGKDGFFSFYARGAKKMGSKSFACCSELSYSSFVFSSSSTGKLTLSEGDSIEYLFSSHGLEQSFCCMGLQEIALKLFHEPEEDTPLEAFEYLLQALRAIKVGISPLNATIVALAGFLRLAGIGLEVGECVNCGKKKDIVTISYLDGGFLCRDCAEEIGSVKTPVEQLKILRFAFACSPSDLPRCQSWQSSDARPLLTGLLDHLENQTGIACKSLRMMLQAQ